MNKNKKEGYTCCNPFYKHGTRRRENIVPASKLLRAWYPAMTAESFVCSGCKTQCYREIRRKKSVLVQDLQRTQVPINAKYVFVNDERLAQDDLNIDHGNGFELTEEHKFSEDNTSPSTYSKANDVFVKEEFTEEFVKEEYDDLKGSEFNEDNTSASIDSKVNDVFVKEEFTEEIVKEEYDDLSDSEFNGDNTSSSIDSKANDVFVQEEFTEEFVKEEYDDLKGSEFNEDSTEQGTSFHVNNTFKEDEQLRKERILFMVNSLLKEFDELPIVSIQTSIADRTEEKLDYLVEKLKFFLVENYKADTRKEEFKEIVCLLKQKFKTLGSYADKIQLLTTLLPSWTPSTTSNEIGCSRYVAQEAKNLQAELGIFSHPGSKKIVRLTDEVKQLVISYYCQDDISRIMPGKRDCISVKVDGLKCQVQKRLILGDLREIYSSFKKENPTIRIGFSKFAELRPEYCILVGAKGTHTACVCQIHQNVKQMILAAKLRKISLPSDSCPETYHEMLQTIMCSPPKMDCHFGKCEQCPGFFKIEHTLKKIFHRNGVEEITFNEWISTDRCQLESVTYSSENYISELKERLVALRKHDFIAKSQSKFLEDTKLNLKNNCKEFIVLLDFSENYSSIIQDEVQAHHWSKYQTTVHPFVIYFKENDKIEQESLVIISDHLEHDISSVHSFQRKLIQYLQEKHGPEIKKIFYFSDGGASQYKINFNFINLVYHFADFGVEAEWHFFATAHGKSPCDEVGGTLKRLATRTSLQSPVCQQIITPTELYEWAVSSNFKSTFEYCSSKEITNNKKILVERFNKAITIEGTGDYHSYVPIENYQKKVKRVSSSESFEISIIVS